MSRIIFSNNGKYVSIPVNWWHGLIRQAVLYSFPRYSTASLTSWYNSQYPTHVIKVLKHYVDKTSMYMEMMDAAEICTKNA